MIPIEVHLATHGDRIKNLNNRLPKTDYVSYLVIHQNYNGCEESDLITRSDITYIKSKSKGVARSRNVALMLSNPDAIILLSDDDVEFDMDIFERIRSYFSDNLIDFCTFKVGLLEDKNVDMLDYGNYSRKLNWKNVGKFGAINFAFRAKFAHENGLSFDPSFGPGAKFSIGEDYVFIQDMLRNGAIGVFMPDRLVYHNKISTGTILSDGLIRDRGPMFYRAHGLFWGLLVSIGFTLRKYGFKALYNTLLGFFRYKL